ncbi:MAG: iron-containing redox enzyme family protein [Pseudomonadota bacterium]
MQRLASGNAGVEHYKAYLRQVFHHTRENPQLQALATVYFKGNQRSVVRRFFTHATSEIGHDRLALEDLEVLGDDVATLPIENPLPATSALLAYGFYQVYVKNPIGYLGYLYFLEFTPTQSGPAYMDRLRDLGVPEEGLTFLRDHTTIDQAHNRLMHSYLEDLISSEEDVAVVAYAMRTTAQLYARMIEDAFSQVERPRDYGIAVDEQRLANAGARKADAA